MLLSALLTSVGINLALSVLFFSLYSILRKQPDNFPVYAPRLLDKLQKQSTTSDHNFNLDRFLPSTGWIRAAWSATEDQLLASSGLDGVVLIRIFAFSLRVFTVGGIIGVLVLLPVNFVGDQLTVDFSDLVNKSLDSFSISNVNDGSKWLWIHFCAAYIFTGVTCYLLYYEYNYISLKRIECFYSSKLQPHQFTLLVRSIPASPGRSYGETLESFFMEYHPSTYLSYSLIHHEGILQKLVKDGEKLRRKLSRLNSKNHSQQITKRAGFLGLFGPQVNAVDHYEKKLGDLEDEIRKEQLFLAGKELPAAFVSFKSRFGAAVALHIRQAVNPTDWLTEPAPQLQEVHWPFFSTSFIVRWIRQLAAICAYIAITILFLVPVVFVQSLANLNQLESWFPSLEGILSITVVSQVITGYLPSFILLLFLMLVPPIMITLSSIEGFISTSEIEKNTCIKMLLFTVWNIFFANALSGSVFYRVDILLEPKYLPSILAVAVPAQASFFISYVVTSGWTSLSSELFRLIPLISCFIKKIIPGEDKFEVPSNPYHTEIPNILFFGLLGVTYFFLAPLILPFLLVYFCMGYIIFRNQLLNVYAPKYETNGKFWPIVHNSTIFSLVLMHVIAIGIFALKELELASILTIPLPILTLLFNEYCRQRFQPIFGSYPTECLKKKDAEDENEPSMAEFYSNLVNAYKDPLFTASVQNAGSTDRLKAPLLQAEL